MIFKPEILVLFVGLFWLLVLTYFFLKFYLYYTKLVKNGEKNSLLDLLEKARERQEILEKAVIHLDKKCEKLERDALLHIQKVGLLRFNPFRDTGGDQSFILALLDAKDTGVIISSLHTRTGTRWYAKRVAQGKGIEYDLSEEEQNALKGATFIEKQGA